MGHLELKFSKTKQNTLQKSNLIPRGIYLSYCLRNKERIGRVQASNYNLVIFQQMNKHNRIKNE